MIAIESISNGLQSHPIECRQLVISEIIDSRGGRTLSAFVLKDNFPHDCVGKSEKRIFTSVIVKRCKDIITELSQDLVDNAKASDSVRAGFNELFEQIVPSRLKEILRSFPHGCLIVVNTNERWIPWELFYDNGAFMGERFCMLRLFRASVDQDLDALVPGTAVSQREHATIVNAIGREVSIEDDTRMLFKAYTGRVKVREVVRLTAAKFISSTEGAAIIHVTSHGQADPAVLLVSEGDEDLIPNDVRRMMLDPGCMVFINACHSAEARDFIEGCISFSKEFHSKGASLFIGTIGKVAAVRAHGIADAFYQQLFRLKRLSYEAFFELKASVGEKDGGLLLYTVSWRPPLSDYPVK